MIDSPASSDNAPANSGDDPGLAGPLDEGTPSQEASPIADEQLSSPHSLPFEDTQPQTVFFKRNYTQ